jgi:integrase-like protein/helix-turn-helix protein
VSAFVDGERSRFGVEPICQALDVSASAYYERRSGRRSHRAVEDERLLERIRELHAANYHAYGYRRMWKALRRAGEQAPRCRVQRLMRSNGIVGAKRRGKPWRTTRPDPQALRRPDLVERNFSASQPNRLWVADLSYLRCWEGLVYFAFVIDAFSRMIVGWQLATHMRTDLVGDALKMALGLRGPGADVDLVHHSDRGSQGGFKWSLQHLDRGGGAWDERRAGERRRRGGRRCVRRAVRRYGVVSIVRGSGMRSRLAREVRMPPRRSGCRRRLAPGGFVRLVGCAQSAVVRSRAATSPSLNVRRSRFSGRRERAFARSPAV